ncbi:hypothetical protein Ahy_B03g062205 isoform A [Arachis hypogaea]|uniref:Uncharacterized protein n=1 Tax=Arachis hypogaea TaxID=3818 RepID=A0A444ZTH7_ARAHY|nr:hypothetical protein Ahy_B03g062205 isoform A [Arachis hypogaea]
MANVHLSSILIASIFMRYQHLKLIPKGQLRTSPGGSPDPRWHWRISRPFLTTVWPIPPSSCTQPNP